MKTRAMYAVAAAALIALGLASRAWREALPAFIGEYSGDTLWAAMTYCAIGFLFPHWRILHKTLAALAFAFAIEFSQFYHAPWIDAIRSNRLAHLVLGDTFVWSDLVCYAVGVLGAAAAERWVRGVR